MRFPRRTHEAPRQPRAPKLEDSQEVQRYMELQQENLARSVGYIFDRVLDQATEYSGIPLTPGKMDDFDFRRLTHPRVHKPGYMREVRLEDGVMLQTTTASVMSDAVHNLLIYKGNRPNEYWHRAINVDSQAYGTTLYANGDEEIATAPSVMHNLGKIVSTFEIERANRWPSMLGAEALAKIQITRPDSEAS